MAVDDAGLVLVSGPSRSGKSRWAESLVKGHDQVTYVATSAPRPKDENWQQRIRVHRERRPAHWTLLETDLGMAEDVARLPEKQAVLIDSLGGFVAWGLSLDTVAWSQQCAQFLDCLSKRRTLVVIVIEETGWGVVPATPIGGMFRDRLGSLAQELEQVSRRSWLVVQGRAIDLHAIGVRV